MKNIRSDYNFKRNNKIFEEYLSGNKSYAALGKKYGLARQRISVIINDFLQKGFGNRLELTAKKSEREDYLKKAITQREVGNYVLSLSMLKEVQNWDEENKNYIGLVDCLGHQRILYTKLAEQPDNNAKDTLIDAIDVVETAKKVIAKNKKLFSLGTVAIVDVHYASTLLALSYSQRAKEKESSLKKALSSINTSIKNIDGSEAHKAWPLKTKAEILIQLKKYDEALVVLLEAEKNIFVGYSAEVKNKDSAEMKLNVWLSGIHLSLSRLAKLTNKPILSQYYKNCVIAQNQDYLKNRREEAKSI